MIKIKDLPTLPPKSLAKDDAEKTSKYNAKKIGELHKVMMAEGKYSLLVVIQGMDASGKDGAVKKTFRYTHPGGLSLYSFKKPSDVEFAHDFLWRVHQQVPRKGEIKIFNRSHYEDILIQAVHGWIDEEHVKKRMKAINAFEELLEFDNNTIIVKFFMNISFDQQTIELQQRIDEADKHWKHNDNDWEERKYWDAYMQRYEYILNNSAIPWTVVPVDERWYRDYIISNKLVEVLESLNMQYPPLDSEMF